VYLVEHLLLNLPRAVKILHREMPGIGSSALLNFRDRFRMEARLGALIQSEFIIRVFDFEESEGAVHLVMEYAGGGNLYERLHPQVGVNVALPIKESLQIALDIAKGLAELHKRDVVHRDLSPKNILFDKRGRAKVADLGLAQVPGGSSLREVLSQPGPHPGAPGYMSPEQATSEGYLTSASDVYALGCVLFEMLTGRMYKGQRPGMRLKELCVDAPEWLDELLVRMLAKEAQQRPWNGGEVVEIIEAQLLAEERAREAEEQARLKEEERERERQEAEERARQEQERLEHHQKAMDMFQQAESLWQVDPEAALSLLEQCESLAAGHLDVEVLRQKIRGKIEHDKKLNQLGSLYNQAESCQDQDPEKALEILNQILADEPDFPGASQLSGQVEATLHQREKQARLKELFEQAERQVGIHPENTLSLLRKIENETKGYPGLATLRKSAEGSLKKQDKVTHLLAWLADTRGLVDNDPVQASKRLAQIRRQIANFPELSFIYHQIKNEIQARQKYLTLQRLFNLAENLQTEDPRTALRLIQQIEREDPEFPKLTELRYKSESMLTQLEKSERLLSWFREAKRKLHRDREASLELVDKIAAEAPNYPSLKQFRQQLENPVSWRTILKHIWQVFREWKEQYSFEFWIFIGTTAFIFFLYWLAIYAPISPPPNTPAPAVVELQHTLTAQAAQVLRAGITPTLTLTLIQNEFIVESGNSPTSQPTTLTPTAVALPLTITDEYSTTMLLVSAGEFSRGLDQKIALEECEKFNSPIPCEYIGNLGNLEGQIHMIYVDAFYMDKTEVTNEMYKKCVEAKICTPPSSNLYYTNAEYANHPVTYVSWDKAKTYCEWRGARLPTEAEWEKAARGVDGRIYPWGNIFAGDRANFCDKNCYEPERDPNSDDGFRETAPVGSFPQGRSPYGIEDMAGNVWEWVADWYGYLYDKQMINPQGPTIGSEKVIRGGSWMSISYSLFTSCRDANDPKKGFQQIGFRCARSADNLSEFLFKTISAPNFTDMPWQTITPGFTTATFSPLFPTKTIVTPPTPKLKPVDSSILNIPPPCTQTGQVWTSPVDNMPMICVPAGDFLMGSTDSDTLADDDEKPLHQVYLDAFWIDQTEVTNAMFNKFVEETSYQTKAEKVGFAWVLDTEAKEWKKTPSATWNHPHGPTSDINGLDNYPVGLMSWYDAVAYCEWAKRRLPMEAEWEKAARGDDGRIYPWGDHIGDPADFANVWWDSWWVYNSYPFTSLVGSYPDGASPYGALDMAGNVWEWVMDWYTANYYSELDYKNPKGPDTGDYRVLRGGSWNNIDGMRAAVRFKDVPGSKFDYFGFRCAR
jgi:formylglycine-generating enzyme required for sulfatase activity/serine/threonine protein kinase